MAVSKSRTIWPPGRRLCHALSTTSAGSARCSKTTTWYVNENYNFAFTEVSTGTWTLYGSIGEPLNVCGSTSVVVTLAGTSPLYPAIILDTPTVSGSVSGKALKDDIENPEGITVSCGGSEDTCNLNGEFDISPVDEGEQTVTANPGGENASYTSESVSTYVVKGQNINVGEITIYPCGKITGQVTVPGGNPLPGIVIRAVRIGTEWGVGLSDSNGDYEISELRVAADYRIEPVLEEEDDSTPDNISPVAVTKGGDTQDNDFEITKAWGYIGGNITDGGEPVETGALIVVSTGTIPSVLPSSSEGVYGCISFSEGQYLLKVRTGYLYNVKGWYTEISDGGTNTKEHTGTADLSGGTTYCHHPIGF